MAVIGVRLLEMYGLLLLLRLFARLQRYRLTRDETDAEGEQS